MLLKRGKKKEQSKKYLSKKLYIVYKKLIPETKITKIDFHHLLIKKITESSKFTIENDMVKINNNNDDWSTNCFIFRPFYLSVSTLSGEGLKDPYKVKI